jgi:glycosyltransferase involved in cell wall biosynthesis
MAVTGTVSVVIPCYNVEAFIGEAIGSVLTQTRPALEILVVDDASTDRTAEIIERQPVELIRLDRNRGPSTARNAAIRRARGDYVAFLDADDVWDPEHLAIVAGLLDAIPPAVVAYSAVRFTGARSGSWGPTVAPEQLFNPIPGLIRQSDQPPQMSAVIRRTALLEVGGYDDAYRYAQDYDLWMRLGRYGPFVCTKTITASYRWHAGQISSTHRFPQLLEAHESRQSHLASASNGTERKLARLARGVLRADLARMWYRDERCEAYALLALAKRYRAIGLARRAGWYALFTFGRLAGVKRTVSLVGYVTRSMWKATQRLLNGIPGPGTTRSRRR